MFFNNNSNLKLRGIGIGAPNGNHYNGKIQTPPNLSWGDVHIVSIFEEKFKQNTILTNDANAAALGEKNFGVAKSWNFLCKQAYKTVDYILMLNDDIYLGKNQKDIYKFIKRTSFDLVHGEKHLCSYILPKRIFKEFVFDENFYPAYFEDNDFKYRLLLKKKKITSSSFLNPEIYRNSQTIMKDRSLNDKFMDNQEYYISKWGGLPNEEKYIKPFNE